MGRRKSYAPAIAAVAALFCSTSCRGFAGLKSPVPPNPHHSMVLRPRSNHKKYTLLLQIQSKTIISEPINEIQMENVCIISPIQIPKNDDRSGSKSYSSREHSAQIITIAQDEIVPSTWSDALKRFFIQEPGPPLVLLSISGFIYSRTQSSVPCSIAEIFVFVLSIIVWWIQEYAFHRVLLHSPFQWIGKSIHQKHHEKTYFHVSIDPPELLIGWLFVVHFSLKTMLPWHLCLTATIGYSLAGLLYEWSHYIVHTRVRPSASSSLKPIRTNFLSKLFSQMRDNHMRHHRIDDRYWYAFSIPAMDDCFNTNPNVKDVRKKLSRNMK